MSYIILYHDVSCGFSIFYQKKTQDVSTSSQSLTQLELSPSSLSSAQVNASLMVLDVATLGPLTSLQGPKNAGHFFRKSQLPKIL